MKQKAAVNASQNPHYYKYLSIIGSLEIFLGIIMLCLPYLMIFSLALFLSPRVAYEEFIRVKSILYYYVYALLPVIMLATGSIIYGLFSLFYQKSQKAKQHVKKLTIGGIVLLLSSLIGWAGIQIFSAHL